MTKEEEKLRSVIAELLRIRDEQHRRKYDPGFELRVNKAWEEAEKCMRTSG